MNAERTLNDTAQSREQHAAACWAALERHVMPQPSRCGCYKLPDGNIEINPACAVGVCAFEEYELAARRVREAQHAQSVLEAGDMGSTLEASKEEYEIATRRVREVKLMQEFIERGEAFSTLEQTLDMLESALAECKAVQS